MCTKKERQHFEFSGVQYKLKLLVQECVLSILSLDMVTFALKTWKNKVKMYKVIGI